MVKRVIIYLDFSDNWEVEVYGSLTKLFVSKPELLPLKEKIGYRLYKLRTDYVNNERKFAIIRRNFNETIKKQG